ncbi:phosphoribosyltransferase [Helicobacter cetorum]|uniref:Putative nucleotide phosphoribosyltransferase n=1 Tax=Helicobacter cetorum (strain ATCC BAA-540 / CCUG 52418 / MIT 99-5656) TaxID=1163745 RepID=I0ETT9_HELCM|nr:phosphoribosyltransferase [Helicobacter cetorum]AFI06358.1 putative nucleotide phosphoribosyltransferase [Helicobacter cetorum MIT 99-5656]
MHYSYETFLNDSLKLAKEIEQNCGIPEAIVCVMRGGMTLTHFLSLYWDLREVYGINAISYDTTNQQNALKIENIPTIKEHLNKILVVDEIVDSGNSLEAVLKVLQDKHPKKKFYSASLFQKPSAKYKANAFLKDAPEWIDFFWEVDLRNLKSL